MYVYVYALNGLRGVNLMICRVLLLQSITGPYRRELPRASQCVNLGLYRLRCFNSQCKRPYFRKDTAYVHGNNFGVEGRNCEERSNHL